MSTGITAPPYEIPPSASSAWDTYLEGTHISILPGPGGADVWTYTANAAITAGQYLVLSSASYVGPSGTGNITGVGVATESAASGAHVPVLMKGLAVVTASGAITAGTVLGASVGGRVAAIDSDVPSHAIGIAITAAGATGDKIIMWVNRP